MGLIMLILSTIENKDMETIKIPGRLESAAIGGIVANTTAIYDTTIGATQNIINHRMNSRIDDISTRIDSVSGMNVIDVSLPPSTLTAIPDNVYLWADNAVDVTITLTTPEDTSKVAVYSFFVKTGSVAPEITFSCGQEYSVVTPNDWEVQTNNWCEIEVMLVGSVFFARIMNYGEQQV